MRCILSSLLLFIASSIYSLNPHYFKKTAGKREGSQIRNIDFIYMINLDARPEKYEASLKELAPYGIVPHRFSAVNGWDLTMKDLNRIGTAYEKWMGKNRWGTFYLPEKKGEPTHEIMRVVGKVYFSHCMARGAIGCALSHLSVLKDAYDSGYETIWVIEDDIQVIQNPHQLAELIDELDGAVGRGKWDILFTDPNTKRQDGKYVPCTGYAWRPDLPVYDYSRFKKRSRVSHNIFRIGARYGTYSMIVRRSGMKKILNFFKERSIFLPFDMEMILPADIKLYTAKKDFVSTLPRAFSDNGAPRYQDQN